MSNERSSKPFKKIDCTRRGFLRMPGNALKIWLYYYTREGAERLAWASEKELCEATGLNRDVMYDWRNWLEENGWLKRMGSKHHGDGRFAMAIFRVKEGTVPEKKDGRKSNRVRKSPTGEPVGKNRTRPVGENRSPSSRQKSESVQSVKIGEEVEPLLQVEPKGQVEPFEVGSKQVSKQDPPLAALAAGDCLTASQANPEGHKGEGYASEEKATPTPDEYRGEPSTQETDEVLMIWSAATGKLFKYTTDGSVDETRDVKALIARYGLEEVKAVLYNTLNERPKTAGWAWTDFNVFARNFELNQRLAKAFKRGQKAKAKKVAAGSHAGANPELQAGLDANGESWVKDEIKWCEHCKNLHTVGDFCVVPPEPELKIVGNGFDVEEA